MSPPSPPSDLDWRTADEPGGRLAALVERARDAGVELPDACCLATADPWGRPSARMVLMRGLDVRGPVIYTNLSSNKSKDLKGNPRAELCFHWQALVEQVRVSGPVERVSEAEADAYWSTRPRDRQLGAWASEQSSPIASRELLEAQWNATVQRFGLSDDDPPIPRPEGWSGWRILADRWEFWEGRPGRLHHRELYVQDPDPPSAAGRWLHSLLQP